MTVNTPAVRKEWNAVRQKPQEVERLSYRYFVKLLDRIEELERLLAERECRECPE